MDNTYVDNEYVAHSHIGGEMNSLFSDKRYVFCFDVESDGLYGEGFAVGAVVIDVKTGKLRDEFSGVVEGYDVKDEFVKKHIIKNLRHMKKYPSVESLRREFWQFYMKYRGDEKLQNPDIIFLVDNGMPVEARFLRDCVMDDYKNRQFLAPFPAVDLATVLQMKGYENHLNRLAFCEYSGTKHHPLDDAMATGLTFLKLIYG